jgi:hypothetical protein
MMKARLDQLFALEAPDKSAADSTQLRLPTLEERVELYLRAVYGEREVTRAQYLRARNLVLDAMATHFEGKVAGSATKPADLVDIALTGRTINLAGGMPVRTLDEEEPLADDDFRTNIPAGEMPHTVYRDAAMALPHADIANTMYRVSEMVLRPAIIASASPSDALEEPIGPKGGLGSPPAVPPAWKLSKHRRFINGFAVGFMAVLFLGVGIHIATLFSVNDQMATLEPGTPVFLEPPPASSGTKGDQLSMVPTQANPVTAPLPAAAAQSSVAFQSPEGKLSSEAIERLITLGRKALVEGNIDGARSALKRAAEAGNATAALELGGTYDPVIVQEIIQKKPPKPPQQVVLSIGVTSNPIVVDIGEAKVWYEKARDLGSAEAAERLKRLTNVPSPRPRPSGRPKN